MSGLTTSNINQILNRFALYKGTYPCDSIPISSKSVDQAFVINTGNSQSSGQHWVGLIIKRNKCWYFDSFGNFIDNLDILQSLKRIGVKRYFSNSKQIQSVRSNNCGYFCIAFVLSFVFEEKYEDFLAKFSENFTENEELCHNLIKQYLTLSS